MRVSKKRGRELLGKVWLFERCSNRELDLLQDAATEMEFPAGKALTTQGETGRHFMVIVEGEAEVSRDGTQIALLGPGSFFGEMSLLDGQPRTATVTTREADTCAHDHDRRLQRRAGDDAVGRSQDAHRARGPLARHRSEVCACERAQDQRRSRVDVGEQFAGDDFGTVVSST